MNEEADAAQRFEFRDFDPDQLREIINGADLEHTILEPGGCAGAVWRWQGGGLSIDRGHYSFPVFVRGQFAAGHLCIGLSRGQTVPTWINGCQLTRQAIQVYAEGADLLYRAGPSTDWMGITVTRDALQEAALLQVGRELDLPAAGMKNLGIPVSMVDRLLRCMQACGRTSSDRRTNAQWSRDRLLQVIVECLFSADLDAAQEFELRARQRAEIFRRADTLFRAMIDQGTAYSSSEICRALGQSERSLQLQFKEALGLSPKMWFRQIALHKVRSRLLSAPVRPGLVTEAALDYGFDHLGRFSESYRKLFDQLPSDTVKGSLARGRSDRDGSNGVMARPGV